LRKTALITGIFLLISMSLFAGSELAGTTSSNFFKIPPFARSVGMGEAFTSVSDGSYALYYNPAGLSSVMGYEVQLSHVEWFTVRPGDTMRYEFLSMVTPFPFSDRGKLGLAFSFFTAGEMNSTQELPGYDPATLDSIDTGVGFDYYTGAPFIPYDYSIILGYGLDIMDDLSAGVAVKYTSENIDASTGSNITADMGFLYRLPVNGHFMRFGLILSHLGSELKMENLGFVPPFTVKLGVSDQFILFDNKILLTGQSIIQMDYDPLFSLGLEYWFYDIFALRMGYKFGAFNHPTVGAGVKYGSFELDYAFVRYDELGNTHRFSLLYKWGTPPVKLLVEPRVFSPNRDRFIDTTFFSTVLKNPDKVNSAKIKIFDPRGEKLLTEIKIPNPLSKNIPWSGLIKRSVLPDGVYRASLLASYDSGDSESGKIPVEIDNTPPALRVDAEPKLLQPGKGESLVIPATFTFYAEDRNNVGGWQFVVWDGNKQIFFNTSGKGEPPLSYIWDGKSNKGDYVETGEIYYYSFSAYDTLGNKAKTKPQSQVVLLKEITLTFASDALFDLGEADVKISAYGILKEMKKVLAKYPDSDIVVSGHTDNLKPMGIKYKSNKQLSKARADAVKFFMINLLSMDSKRIKTVGHGDEKPIASNDTANGRLKNRRVEIKIQSTIYK